MLTITTVAAGGFRLRWCVRPFQAACNVCLLRVGWFAPIRFQLAFLANGERRPYAHNELAQLTPILVNNTQKNNAQMAKHKQNKRIKDNESKYVNGRGVHRREMRCDCSLSSQRFCSVLNLTRERENNEGREKLAASAIWAVWLI